MNKKDQLSESLEDYLETILALQTTKTGPTRSIYQLFEKKVLRFIGGLGYSES